MSGWLLALIAFVYLYVAIDYVRDHRYGMALAFAAYALANLGFILDLKVNR